MVVWRDALAWQPGWVGLAAGALALSFCTLAALLLIDVVLPGGQARHALLRKVLGAILTAVRNRLGLR
jgi:hypothetical protein